MAVDSTQVEASISFSPLESFSVPGLPEDVFLLILENLDPWDVIRCRRVSRAWNAVFSKEEYLHIKLKEYADAREVQHLHIAGILSQPTDDTTDWKGVFDRIASRYFHLSQGTSRSVNRYKLAAIDQIGQWYPVSQWDYHESQPGGRLYYENATHLSRMGGKPYLFRPTFWTYDDGLLVFAPSESNNFSLNGSVPHGRKGALLVVLEVETKTAIPVPFDTTGRVLRNIRLKDRTLVIEWAEKDPWHDLNDSEKVHRHFATCFDIKPLPQWSRNTAPLQSPHYTVSFRSEWKMHFLGLPLNSRDRFFSTHNAHHYAVYFWKPNRGMYTGDEELPIESLHVWDISIPSDYLPSTDPAGQNAPKDPKHGPQILSRFSFHALDFLGIRQHSNISLMKIELDSEAHSVIWRGNAWAAGQGYFDPAERLWCARTSVFPFIGEGPCCVRESLGDDELPPYRGHVGMESATLDGEGSESWFLPIMDVYDDTAGVRFKLVEICLSGSTLFENRKIVRVRVGKEGEWVSMKDRLVDMVTCMGRIAGDERWLVGQGSGMELVVLKF